MSTDLVHADSQAMAVLNGANDALARLGQWVEAANNAHRLVVPLIDTYFIPEAYRPKTDPRATAEEKTEARRVAIGNATAAVLQGITLGLDPMTALQQIYVVHGRPGMYAKIKVALVQSKGHEVWTEDVSDSRAVVAGRRHGTESIERVTVTMDQARKAGWTRNDNYAKTPQDMLWARAASRVCDRIASDALMGIASVEEIQDELAPTYGGTRTVTPRRAIQSPPQTDASPNLLPDLDMLRTEAAAAGVKVDRRWGADRLHDEIAAAKSAPMVEQPPLEPEEDNQPVLEDGWPETAKPGEGKP